MSQTDILQVVIIDMLEGFTRVGPLASPRVDALVDPMAAFLRKLSPDDLVVFVCDAHDPDDVEFRRFPPHCIRGTRQAVIRPELTEAVKESGVKAEFVEKTSFSAFYRTRMEEIVAAARSDAWVVIGCVTDCCVETIVGELTYRGRRVTVLRDLVDTWDMPKSVAEELGLPPCHLHDADAINAEWFEHRFPAIWGATVTDSASLLARRLPTGHRLSAETSDLRPT